MCITPNAKHLVRAVFCAICVGCNNPEKGIPKRYAHTQGVNMQDVTMQSVPTQHAPAQKHPGPSDREGTGML